MYFCYEFVRRSTFLGKPFTELVRGGGNDGISFDSVNALSDVLEITSTCAVHCDRDNVDGSVGFY